MTEDLYRSLDQGLERRIRDLRRDVAEREPSSYAGLDLLTRPERDRLERARRAVEQAQDSPHALIGALEEYRDLLEQAARQVESELARVPREVPYPETLDDTKQFVTRRSGKQLSADLRFPYRIIEEILQRGLEEWATVYAMEDEAPLGWSAICAKYSHRRSPMALLWTWQKIDAWVAAEVKGRLFVATSVPRMVPDLRLCPRRLFSPLIRAILSGGRCIKTGNQELDRRFDLISGDKRARDVVTARAVRSSLRKLSFFSPTLQVRDSVAELEWGCRVPGRAEIEHASQLLYSLRRYGR
jgi:hypothetical protein